MLLAILAVVAALQFGVLGAPGPLPMNDPFGAALATTPAGRSRRSAPGCSACSGSCRCSTPPGPRSIRPRTRRIFDLLAPLTPHNFVAAWHAAPFARYLLNTFLLVTLVLAAQFVLCTPAAFAFARLSFPGRDTLFALVLLQLMVMPDVLLVANYRTLAGLGLVDSILGIALPYLGSAFGIFLLRQTFRQVPQELDDAARLEGSGLLARLWRVYVPLARPTYIAYGLVSVSYHWNNFLWPLVITNRVGTRPLTVGLSVFASTDQGIDWSIMTAATLMTSGAAAAGVPAVPAPVRAELHARGDQVIHPSYPAERFSPALPSRKRREGDSTKASSP